MNLTDCPTCHVQAQDPEVMREWIWVRSGNEGHWFCSWACLKVYAVLSAIEEEKEHED